MTEQEVDKIFIPICDQEINVDYHFERVHVRQYTEKLTALSHDPQYGFHFSQQDIVGLNTAQVMCFYKAEYVRDEKHIEELKAAHLATHVYIGWVTDNSTFPIQEYGNEIRQVAGLVQMVKIS